MIFIEKPPRLRYHTKRSLRVKLKQIRSTKDSKLRSKLIGEVGSPPRWVVEKLLQSGHGKCWYCERKLPPRELVVEHFRPKRSVGAVKGHPGYFWLSASSHNFRISCTSCNVRWTNETGQVVGKGTYFPLMNESDRASSSRDDLRKEQPLLMDPLVRSDCESLVFQRDGSCTPYSDDHIQVNRAFVTINLYNLNQSVLVEARKRLWDNLELLFQCAKNDPQMRSILLARVRDAIAQGSTFASSARSAVKVINRDFGFSL